MIRASGDVRRDSMAIGEVYKAGALAGRRKEAEGRHLKHLQLQSLKPPLPLGIQLSENIDDSLNFV